MQLSEIGSSATVDLIERYRDGDEEAGNALFARYYPRVRQVVRIRFLSRGVAESEIDDLIQETCLSAVRGFREYRQTAGCGFIHWLARIAENELKDALRRAGALKRDRRREVPFEELAGSPGSSSGGFDPADDTAQVPSKVGRGEELRIVESCLVELPEHYREVIVLRDLEGCAWSFVAEKLERPTEDAAIKLYGRARAALASAVHARKHKRP